MLVTRVPYAAAGRAGPVLSVNPQNIPPRRLWLLQEPVRLAPGLEGGMCLWRVTWTAESITPQGVALGLTGDLASPDCLWCLGKPGGTALGVQNEQALP